MKHWFFINSKTLQIFTYGSGNHPSQTYNFEDEKEFLDRIESFKKGDYEFIKDQGI